jgi:hypothetical protein
MVVDGLVCGAITSAALGSVLGALAGYQVPDYTDMDPVIGLGGSLAAAIGAAAVIAVVRIRGSWPRTHVVVPLVLLPLVIAPLVLGLERNRLEAGLLFGAAAFAVHLSLGRRLAVAGIAVTVVVAGLATWGCQERWRAQKFEAVGVPLYVPEVPGYRLAAVWAGRWSVTQTLTTPGGARLDVQLLATTDELACGPGRPERQVLTALGSPSRLGICLPGGGTMIVKPAAEQLTVRQVNGATLAAYPDSATAFEPD